MGATLVAQAIQHWSHISDRAFRVLVTMAVTAKDNASKEVAAGLYFGGHDALVIALNLKEGTSQESALKTVQRATRELMEVGAIRLSQGAVSGGRAVYQLTLNAIPLPRKRSNSEAPHFTDRPASPSTNINKEVDTGSPPQGDTECPPQLDTGSPPEVDTECPTYKEPLEEPLEELKKEEGVAPTTDLTVTRANASAEKPQSNSSACRDPTCQLGYLYDPTKPKGHRNIPCPECRPTKPTNVIPFQRKAGT